LRFWRTFACSSVVMHHPRHSVDKATIRSGPMPFKNSGALLAVYYYLYIYCTYRYFYNDGAAVLNTNECVTVPVIKGGNDEKK
jgi:hypothetical protein